jgi:hypothetical protein
MGGRSTCHSLPADVPPQPPSEFPWPGCPYNVSSSFESDVRTGENPTSDSSLILLILLNIFQSNKLANV